MLSQEDLDQIIMALKAEGVDFTALQTVASLVGLKSLPAILNGELVDVPIELLSQPAKDAADKCLEIKTTSETAIKQAQTDASTAIAKAQSDASTAISNVETTAKKNIGTITTTAKETIDTAATAANKAAATATGAAKGANDAKRGLENMLPSLVLNDGGEMNALAAILAALVSRVNSLQNLVADMLGGRATFRVLSVDNLICNDKNNIVEFGEGAPAEAPYDKGRVYIDVKNDIVYKSIHNESPSGWSNK